MLLLASSNSESHKYVLFEREREVQYLSLKGLGYFKRALGMDDYLKTFQSWIARQEPLFLGCLAGNSLVGWCMFEQWEKWDRDRTPIYVLRTIEVRTGDRDKKIGRNLMTLLALVTPGHMVTRPLSANAKGFFEHMGFISPPDDAQIDFSDKYGYLLLPSIVKRSLLRDHSNKELLLDDANIAKCSSYLKVRVLREELSHVGGFAQAFTTTLSAHKNETEGVKTFIKTDTSRTSCVCGSRTISLYTITNGEQDHLNIECDRCGEVWLSVPI